MTKAKSSLGRPVKYTAEQQRAAIVAFHKSPRRSATVVAKEIGIARSTIFRIWNAARAAGDQPNAGGAIAPLPPIRAGRDPLLAALKREHGDDPRRARDTVRVDRFDRPMIKTRQSA